VDGGGSVTPMCHYSFKAKFAKMREMPSDKVARHGGTRTRGFESHPVLSMRGKHPVTLNFTTFLKLRTASNEHLKDFAILSVSCTKKSILTSQRHEMQRVI